jgi:hypothetical protein
LLDIRVVRQDTAPTAANGTLWFNTVEGRLYIKYSDVWVDAAPLVQPPPDTDLDVNSITFPDASVQTSAYINRLDNGDFTALFGEDGWLRVRKLSTNQSYFNLVPIGNEDNTYGVQIGTGNQASWTFLDNGTLTLPASSNDFYTTTNALIKSIADIQISAGDDVGSNWVFGGNGNLTLPSGGTISEGIVTSNPTIQLTPDNPTVASQKLVIKGGGSYQTDANGISLNLSNITFQVGDAVDAYIYAPAEANQTLYWWIVPEGAGIADPDSITLDNDGYGTVTFELDSDDYEFRIRISPEDNNYDPESIGVESLLINGDAPTFEGDHHLHLTTGALNETSIILGTDEHNVRTTIEGKIQITTPGESSNVWEFDTDGVLTFPSGMAIGDLDGAQGILGNVDTPIGILAQGSTGAATLQWVDDFENATSISAVVVNSQYANTGDVQIITGNVGPTPEHSWTFGTNGTTTFPDDKIKCPISDSISIETEILPTAPPTTIVISGADFVAVNLTYIKDPYDPNWFPADYNSLTDPHITYQDSQWKILSPGFDQALYVNTGTINVPLAQWNTNPPLGSVAPTGVYTYADTYTRTWQFGSNGNLTLPNNSTISDTPAVAQYSSSFSMGAYADDGLRGYFTARSDFHYTGNPLINTVTAGWFVSGPGLIGVKEIIAKTAAGEPGDWAITVDLTDGSTWPFDESSYTFYSPDYQIVPAGSTLTVNSNEWKFGANGSLTFPDATVQTTAYNPNSIRSEGDINIDINLSDSTLRRWSFGEDGNLNIPGDIITSTGTVLQSAQRVEGSWTAATGTNTYSFTVPMDGTYTMWVKGNIPNGIITWNATVSVSNSNVPAIGTQYAWNYTGGGSPILLTAMPDQIRGTAGTISTDATYAGTTSNRFDFTIANTSGSAQTVYYGYTKV